MNSKKTLELSVIIPARHEMFLTTTVENVLKNIEADTEVIVVLDGYWPDPPLFDNPRVTVIHFTTPVGQRGGTNAGARLSEARYIMKLDAHCAVGKGFDRILMEDCEDDWTMIPKMWALNAFEWECTQCGNITGQGTKLTKCDKCKRSIPETDFKMNIAWERRGNKVTYSWRFDKDMRFQYWRHHHKRPECQEDVFETMSCIGACFFMPRKRFWDLGGMDEAHGSWGQFGTELACKAWLSGGKMVTTKKTWFAHMFRTGNFRESFEYGTFPYPISGEEMEISREYSRDLWLNDKWPKAIHPLSWLVDRFKPVPGWHE